MDRKRVKPKDLKTHLTEKDSKTNTQKHRRLNIQKGIDLKSIKVSLCFAILFSATILVYLTWFSLTIYYSSYIHYGDQLSTFLKGDLISLTTALITMKQYT